MTTCLSSFFLKDPLQILILNQKITDGFTFDITVSDRKRDRIHNYTGFRSFVTHINYTYYLFPYFGG